MFVSCNKYESYNERKSFFKLTFKRKVVNSLWEYKLLSFFQVLFAKQNIDMYAKMFAGLF